MSWEEAGAGESQAKKKWREARLCSWLKTETTQSAARLPVWHSGVMALLSLIYQTKAFSALQHRAFCRPQWYLQKNRWSKPPALKDSAIQSWQPTSCCGICPWGCPAFCVFLWAVTTFDFDYSYFFFLGFLLDLYLFVFLDFCALFIRPVCCSVTCSPGVGEKGTCEEHYRCINCWDTCANLHSLTPVCFASPGLQAGGSQMVSMCIYKWLSSPALILWTD